MNDITSTTNDTFNARHKSSVEVVADFIPPPQFEELMAFNNCILVGPRGSGKTTLLKMLQAPALLSWTNSKSDRTVTSIKFLGVFVAADVRWAKQLELVTKDIEKPALRTAIHECAFSNFVSLALIEALEKSLALGILRPIDSVSDEFGRIQQAELSKKLSDIWKTQSTPSFSALKHALRVQQSELQKISSRLALTASADLAFTEYPFIGLGWLNSFTLAIETINDQLNLENQKWALLVDELEIIPQDLLERILSPLRSTSGNLVFKYALSQTGAGSKFLSSKEEDIPRQSNDFSIIPLWNEKKEDTRNFASMLLSHALKNKGVIGPEADLAEALGLSGSAEETTDAEKENDSGRISIEQRKKIFSELERKDTSFSEFLNAKKIDISDLPTSDKITNGTLVRKITPLVYLRNHLLKSWSMDRYVKRSKVSSQPYQRFPNILDLTEGNPRWILNLAETLASETRKKGASINSQGVQASAISAFTDRFISMLKVYPIRSTQNKSSITPYGFLQILAEHIQEKIFFNSFSPDPALSFTIDEQSAIEFGEFISICIHLGALVFVDTEVSKESVFVTGASGLQGRHVRICHRLAPEFFLPLRAGRHIKMYSALTKVKDEIYVEKVTPVKATKTPVRSPDAASQLKLF
ncbi:MULTISPECIES: hypothetical protein [Pseudomonas]|uniref:ORC-CDC6 family AAA ATPase n=1 Tax=Pseudomonas TaxID=286 RepID=UPI001A9F35FA|nr:MULTISPECIES: hypothetical protein [Pseudomonas]MDH1259179.1 hypothetical protein [Pseudomonas atacamensis]